MTRRHAPHHPHPQGGGRLQRSPTRPSSSSCCKGRAVGGIPHAALADATTCCGKESHRLILFLSGVAHWRAGREHPRSCGVLASLLTLLVGGTPSLALLTGFKAGGLAGSASGASRCSRGYPGQRELLSFELPGDWLSRLSDRTCCQLGRWWNLLYSVLT